MSVSMDKNEQDEKMSETEWSLVSSVPKFCRWSPIFAKIYGGGEQVLKKFDNGSINLMLGA